MGKHAEKFEAGRATQLRMYIIANLGVVVACLFDYVFVERQYALEMLAIFVALINGFALWQQRHDHNAAVRRDRENETEKAQAKAARDARLKVRGLR